MHSSLHCGQRHDNDDVALNSSFWKDFVIPLLKRSSRGSVSPTPVICLTTDGGGLSIR